MPAQDSAGPTGVPAHMVGEIHNWTELLGFFNHTLPECYVELSEDAKRVVLFVLYLATFVVGLVENVLVICVHCRCSGRTGLLQLYVLHMALADLGVVLTLPVWLLEVMLDYTWLWGSFSCRFVHYFYFANMYSSVFFLLCLSVDRYVTVTRSAPSWRLRRAVCAGVWVVSAIIPLPQVAHMQLVDSFEPMCLFMAPFESYDTWALVTTLSATILGFLLPFPLIVTFHSLTVCRLRRAGRASGRRHGLLVSAYLVVFALSWLPYHVITLLITLHGSRLSLHCSLVHTLYFLSDVASCVSNLHCMLSPVLYNFLSRNFRGQLLSTVVRYLPKVQARAGRRASSSSSSSTQHSIIITKEGAQPATACPPSPQNFRSQVPNPCPPPASPLPAS